MEKKIVLILLIISVMFSFAACSILNIRKSARAIPFGRDVPELYAEENDVSEEQDESTADASDLYSLFDEGSNIIGNLGGILGALKDADSASSMLGDLLPKSGWPSGSVPRELPEYTDGEIINSGGSADDFTILVRNTDAEALDNYMNKLKEAGWIVTMDYDEQKKAVLGPYSLTIQTSGQGSSLSINIITAEQGSWPYDKLPPDLLPPETGTLVGDIEIEYHGDMMYFVYTFDDMDEDAAADYMMMLIDNGWKGDETYVSKTFEWNGKKYKASIEVYEIIETRSSFVFDMYAE